MLESKKLRERRTHKRRFPKEWVSAFCQTSIVGISKLVDISKGGVAFQYVQGPGVSLATLKKPLKVDLFETVTSHGVKGIDCNVVYDTELPRQDNPSGRHRLRRCGVRFYQPNWYQALHLDTFIRDFTVEED